MEFTCPRCGSHYFSMLDGTIHCNGESSEGPRTCDFSRPQKCQCGCDCEEDATVLDDGGDWVCRACADYTTDEDGDVICSRDHRAETVTECCGAGGQTRTYVRLRPPEMPESDDAGDYCCFWDTAGDGSCVVSRYTTVEDARRAVQAMDWPPPGDHTPYLCAYEVRQLIDGRWQAICEDI